MIADNKLIVLLTTILMNAWLGQDGDSGAFIAQAIIHDIVRHVKILTKKAKSVFSF